MKSASSNYSQPRNSRVKEFSLFETERELTVLSQSELTMVVCKVKLLSDFFIIYISCNQATLASNYRIHCDYIILPGRFCKFLILFYLFHFKFVFKFVFKSLKSNTNLNLHTNLNLCLISEI